MPEARIFKNRSTWVAPAEEGPLAAPQSPGALGNVPSILREFSLHSWSAQEGIALGVQRAQQRLVRWNRPVWPPGTKTVNQRAPLINSTQVTFQQKLERWKMMLEPQRHP